MEKIYVVEYYAAIKKECFRSLCMNLEGGRHRLLRGKRQLQRNVHNTLWSNFKLLELSFSRSIIIVIISSVNVRCAHQLIEHGKEL